MLMRGSVTPSTIRNPRTEPTGRDRDEGRELNLSAVEWAFSNVQYPVCIPWFSASVSNAFVALFSACQNESPPKRSPLHQPSHSTILRGRRGKTQRPACSPSSPSSSFRNPPRWTPSSSTTWPLTHPHPRSSIQLLAIRLTNGEVRKGHVRMLLPSSTTSAFFRAVSTGSSS